VGYALVFLVQIFLTGCGTGAKEANTLVIGRGSDNVSLDPAISSNNIDQSIFSNLYQQLMQHQVEEGRITGVLEGELASSWKVSDNRLAWTFQIERGHHFSDGSELTASAVKYTFERTKAVNRSPSSSLAWLDYVEVSASMEVTFHLNFPFPLLLSVLAMPGTAIINPLVELNAVDGDRGSAWLSEHSAGSGPYLVERWYRDERLVLVPNPHYKNKEVFFNRVIFEVVKDNAIGRLRLANGDLDIYEGVSFRTAKPLSKHKNVKLVLEDAGNDLHFLIFNTEHAILNDVRVRRAIALAIDYNALTEDIYSGYAKPIRGTLLPGFPGHNPDIPLPHRNLDEARALLKAAGFPNNLKLTLSVGYTNAVVEALQSQLAEVGIQLEIQQVYAAALDAQRASGNFELMLGAWLADFPDPWIIMEFMFSSRYIGAGANASRYRNPEVDRLLAEGYVAQRMEDRARIYDSAQRLIMADLPQAFLYTTTPMVALRTDIDGFVLNRYQLGSYNLDQMSRRMQ